MCVCVCVCVCVLPAKAVAFLGQMECGDEEEDNEILKKTKKTKKKQADLSEARPVFLPFWFPKFPGCCPGLGSVRFLPHGSLASHPCLSIVSSLRGRALFLNIL